ncbi:hypothetical protein [Aliikangiella coralliicola]|uniref:Uncharacterized protein n=1 Tax=Aliikangiella coralliicola TaxID=2592383 RepID=A0A545UJX1_9GAMM|nr:hypothetical protein [Aliikangiella coralliicola]TQV89765.1 hypothetical protein FLL46_02475 [Aliikangiella coralliicola]
MSFFKYLTQASLLLCCSIANAEITPITSENRVNPDTAGHQNFPIVASDNQGNYVIAYNESVNKTYSTYVNFYRQDGSLIRSNRYNGGSTKITQQQVAMNEFGVSAAVFTANSNSYLQIYDAQGLPKFSGFVRLNSNQNLSYSSQGIAINSNGEIAITWLGCGSSPYRCDVYTRQLHADGYWLSNEIKISSGSSSTSSTYGSSIGIDPWGDFVVAWIESKSRRAYSKHFYKGGNVKRNTASVFTTILRNQGYPKVAVNQSNGEHMIYWSSMPKNYGAGNYWNVYARKYDSNGRKDGAVFQINQQSSMWEPTARAIFDDYGFLVAWNRDEGDDREVYAASFSADGTNQSAKTRLNAYTTGQQKSVSISRLTGGEFIAAWTSYQQDGDGLGIYSRKFTE